ncbi:hypothetical protein BJV82DRAFT_508611 [Fennellomyces sp. T-0311]|nr:hypothetical protein BJV82DRAFT_508611 [Fennellomyces sp. T-0311]
MMVFKLVQTHTTYDGLAMDVSEGATQGSVIAVLVVALMLAIPSRGIAFGQFKKIQSPSFKETMTFVKKYHGYVMSFGTVLNFHYHPASHRNKYWVLLLEAWVFLHGTLTAIIQPGTNWQIFSYGFAIIFFVNQLYDTPIPKRHPWLLAFIYVLFSVAVAYGFRENRAYYKMTFVPVAEYLCLLTCIGVGMATAVILRNQSPVVRIGVTTIVYVSMGALLTVGLAIVLAGNLNVYNDY